MLEFRRISSHDILEEWPTIKPFIERALDKSDGELALEDVLWECHWNKMTAYVIEDEEIRAVLVLKTQKYPQMRVLFIYLLSGEGIGDWDEFMVQSLKELATKYNYDAIESQCRPGFSRMFSKHGFNPKYTVMRSYDIHP